MSCVPVCVIIYACGVQLLWVTSTPGVCLFYVVKGPQGLALRVRSIRVKYTKPKGFGSLLHRSLELDAQWSTVWVDVFKQVTYGFS